MVAEFVGADPPVVDEAGGDESAELKGRYGVFPGKEDSRSSERGLGKWEVSVGYIADAALVVERWGRVECELVEREGEDGIGCTELGGLDADGAGAVSEGSPEELELELEWMNVLGEGFAKGGGEMGTP